MTTSYNDLPKITGYAYQSRHAIVRVFRRDSFLQETGLRTRFEIEREYEIGPTDDKPWGDTDICGYRLGVIRSHTARREYHGRSSFDAAWIHTYLIKMNAGFALRRLPGISENDIYKALVDVFYRRCSCSYDCCGHIFHHNFALRRVSRREYRFSFWASINV